jgi:cytoskeleton protein RodZ
MNDESGNSVDESAPSEPEGAACGERLAEARRALQITVLEIAKELHLDEPKVRALENNDFAVLGAPVFAKGHMRKYAELVDVDVDDVLADYYRLTRASGMPPVVLHRAKVRQELSPGPWIVAIVVILAAAFAYWLIVTRAEPTVEIDSDSPPQSSQATTPAADRLPEDDAAVTMAAASVDANVDDTPASNSAPVAASADVVAVPETVIETAEDGQLNVALSFSGECWTEISDADGRRLFFDMGRSGRSVKLSGKAPFAALVGNVENVDLQVNGNDYEIPALGRSGRTARFSILSPQP